MKRNGWDGEEDWGPHIPFGLEDLHIRGVYTITQKLYHQHVETSHDLYCDFILFWHILLGLARFRCGYRSDGGGPDATVHMSRLFSRNVSFKCGRSGLVPLGTDGGSKNWLLYRNCNNDLRVCMVVDVIKFYLCCMSDMGSMDITDVHGEWYIVIRSHRWHRQNCTTMMTYSIDISSLLWISCNGWQIIHVYHIMAIWRYRWPMAWKVLRE